MRGGIKNVIKIRAQLFCVEGWGREMQKKARLDLSKASEEQERRRQRPWTAARAGPSAESLEDRKASLGGVSTKLKNNDTPRENLMPIPVIKTHILHCFAFNFFFFFFFSSSVTLSLSFPSALLFSSLFSTRTPLAVAERYSHFQRLRCHAPPLSPVWNFNVHVVRVPSGVIDRSVPEQHRAWQAGCLLSEAAEERQQRKGAEEEKTHINKTKLLLPISQ